MQAEIKNGKIWRKIFALKEFMFRGVKVIGILIGGGGVHFS
jgi:hypothetical protein